MNQKRDAYDKLFELIDKDLFFQNGINDIVFVKNEKIKSHWEELQKSIFENKTVFIRGYGRDAKGTELYFKLYEKMFGNTNIKKDPSNNTEPTKVLKSLTQYSKIKHEEKTLIVNYQISHIFGKTKNPFLFTSPWNIAYIPKYLDPFTGHETQGEHSIFFKKLLLPIVKNQFKVYIEEYNFLIRSKIKCRIDESLDFVKASAKISSAEFDRFELDVRKELCEISFDELFQ